MTLGSAMGAGVSGLRANSSKIATISDNIANSATHGYKRNETEFDALVLASSGGTYTAGGVLASTSRNVAQAGALISTSSSTDIAIAGPGMLPVTPVTDVYGNAPQPQLLMTRTGGFSADESGYLRTDSGFVLLGWAALPNGQIPSLARDTSAGLEPIRIPYDQAQSAATTRINLGVNLPATDTLPSKSGDPTGDPILHSIEYFGNLGTSERLEVTYTPDTSNPDGMSLKWQVDIRDRASNEPDKVIGSYRIEFDGSTDYAGTIKAVETLEGGDYDAETGSFTIGVADGEVEIVIGKPNDPNGLLRQMGDTYAPTSVTKDGARVGRLTSVEIDERGLLKATYDTGIVRTLYQVPVVSVPNVNGLQAGSAQTFSISQTSGGFFLWDAGDGPTGKIQGYAREASTTDIAEELTEMIQTQRAYATNAKVIQTVDEMLQETTNIKR